MPVKGFVPPDELKRVADLRFDRGYQNLCDYIQAHLDNIVTKLSEMSLSDEESLRLLRHWRSMRAVHQIMLQAPEAFAVEISVTPEVGDKVY